MALEFARAMGATICYGGRAEQRKQAMSDAIHPIHQLLDRLVEARLAAIQALAGQEISEGSPSSEQMRRVAELHLVLAAVRDEIGRHEVSPGHSSEKPLE